LKPTEADNNRVLDTKNALELQLSPSRSDRLPAGS
jgi:hypothetical protein